MPVLTCEACIFPYHELIIWVDIEFYFENLFFSSSIEYNVGFFFVFLLFFSILCSLRNLMYSDSYSFSDSLLFFTLEVLKVFSWYEEFWNWIRYRPNMDPSPLPNGIASHLNKSEDYIFFLFWKHFFLEFLSYPSLSLVSPSFFLNGSWATWSILCAS